MNLYSLAVIISLYRVTNTIICAESFSGCLKFSVVIDIDAKIVSQSEILFIFY